MLERALFFRLLGQLSFMDLSLLQTLIVCWYSLFSRKAPILPFSDHDMTLVGGNHVQQTWQQQSQNLQLSRTPENKLQVLQSQCRSQKQQLHEAEVLQGPQTPFSRPPIPGKCASLLPHSLLFRPYEVLHCRIWKWHSRDPYVKFFYSSVRLIVEFLVCYVTMFVICF